MEKRDQSQLAAETVAAAKAAFDGGANLDDATTLEALLNAEKKCRLANDSMATRDVVRGRGPRKGPPDEPLVGHTERKGLEPPDGIFSVSSAASHFLIPL
jgi:hypothetical protein